MLRLSTLFFLVLVSCFAYLPGMEYQPFREMMNQTPRLPGGSIPQTGIYDTVWRDVFCGWGFIKSSIMATIMVAALSNSHDGPCYNYDGGDIIPRPCFMQWWMAFICILGPACLKGVGWLYNTTNKNPTEQAAVWRDRCRVLYGIATVWAILNAEYVFVTIKPFLVK